MTGLSSAASRRLKQTHRGSTLLGDVERHVMRESMKSDRDMSFLHPSDMAKTDFCHRRGYYQVTGAAASTIRTLEVCLLAGGGRIASVLVVGTLSEWPNVCLRSGK